jgi:HAD superfamily hydrolase (TIGR01490 family)
MSSKRLAVFDFCGTIADFQTADPFVDFILQDRKTASIILKDAARQLLQSSRLLKGEAHKKMKLSLLTGHSKDLVTQKAAEYIEHVVLKRLHAPVIDRLKQHRADGDTIVIVSGGYQPYLDVFAKQFGVHTAIGTKIKFETDLCVGVFDGPNCMGETKIELLRQAVALDDYDLAGSHVYSDDRSDIPLLKLVGKPVVVATESMRPWYRPFPFQVLNV